MKQSPHKICLDDIYELHLNAAFEQKNFYPKTKRQTKKERNDLHPRMNQVEQHHDQGRE